MFYATAGQQATQPPPTAARAAAPGAYGRAGPPGFGSRAAADPNDFPALGSHSHGQTYAQTSGASSGAPPPSQSQAQPGQSTQQQLQQQQQLYLQQQQQLGGVPPPPPPGIAGPAGGQSNGDEFPALGPSGTGAADGKDARLANFLRSNPGNPSSPSLPNGAGTSASQSQSTNATPSTNPPHLSGSGGGAPSDASWQRQHSPSRPSEPVVRPVQQILSSPVDKWGLKALLYEIQMHMNKTDRGMLVFGEELEELGLDVNSEEPLYPTFVTPWADPSISQSHRIEEPFHIPSCYNVHAPPVQTKLPNFAEDTLFYAFYMSPQDVLQLEVAEELYARGWRYHTELQTWITSPTLQTIDLSKNDGQANWVRGPFLYLDTRTWTKQRTAEDYSVDVNAIEVTRSAAAIVAEETARKEHKSPNPNSNPNTNGQARQAQAQGQGQQPFQR